MLSQLKGGLVRTLFLPDWKVLVTEDGRERLRRLMTMTFEESERVRTSLRALLGPTLLLMPGVSVRRPK